MNRDGIQLSFIQLTISIKTKTLLHDLPVPHSFCQTRKETFLGKSGFIKNIKLQGIFFFLPYTFKNVFYPHKNPYHLKPDIQIIWLTSLANQLFSADPRKQPSMDL